MFLGLAFKGKRTGAGSQPPTPTTSTAPEAPSAPNPAPFRIFSRKKRRPDALDLEIHKYAQLKEEEKREHRKVSYKGNEDLMSLASTSPYGGAEAERHSEPSSSFAPPLRISSLPSYLPPKDSPPREPVDKNNENARPLAPRDPHPNLPADREPSLVTETFKEPSPLGFHQVTTDPAPYISQFPPSSHSSEESRNSLETELHRKNLASRNTTSNPFVDPTLEAAESLRVDGYTRVDSLPELGELTSAALMGFEDQSIRVFPFLGHPKSAELGEPLGERGSGKAFASKNPYLNPPYSNPFASPEPAPDSSSQLGFGQSSTLPSPNIPKESEIKFLDEVNDEQENVIYLCPHFSPLVDHELSPNVPLFSLNLFRTRRQLSPTILTSATPGNGNDEACNALRIQASSTSGLTPFASLNPGHQAKVAPFNLQRTRRVPSPNISTSTTSLGPLGQNTNRENQGLVNAALPRTVSVQAGGQWEFTPPRRRFPGLNSERMDAYCARRGYLNKSEGELAINIRKATSIEETAPKRKHVRSCIVYTWDHKSSSAFWAGMKVQPIMADEIQTFKALITVHKVLQEGHPVTLREAMSNRSWIESLNRGMSGEGLRGYAPLIKEYIYFLLAKLSFHQHHPEFNGTFEYEEYISLKSINDPNEGYETITDLMHLQDKIEQFQKLIFSHFKSGGHNECRISALVPLVQESYGIYKFITSMLRAMHTTTGDDEALEPLRGRYDAQHYRLIKFYDECSNLRYLTSLITVPKLPQDPPNLLSEDMAPRLPQRPKQEIERAPSPVAPPPKTEEPDDINEFWKQEQTRQLREYEDQQRVLEERQAQQLYAQQQAAMQAQQAFEEQQRQLAEQQRREQEALMQQQSQWQTQGRLAELEQENLNARAQYERDQLLLGQYDNRVKALEGELANIQNNYGQQIGSKDDQIKALQEQLNTWRTKYEALAKLYSQLRTEHLDLLQKFKSVQLKAASAQEAIDKREKLEREIKTKNLELADMIRERDRALHEKDRLSGGNREELEKLKRELRMALDRAENSERSKGNELSTMLSKYNREMADLEDALRKKSRALEEVSSKYREGDSDLERLLREKEDEIEIMKMGMDQTLMELNDMKLSQGEENHALDGQIDAVLLSNIEKINDIIDSVLQSGVQRVDDALYELDSSMQAGNQNASPSYVLSQIEKASASATEFATSFNNFIADGPNSTHAEIIRTINIFAGSISDVLSNTKGLTRLATDEKKSDQLINAARQSAQSTVKFFRGLQSFRLDGMDPMQKTDVVINNNNDVQMQLQKLNKLADTFAPQSGKLVNNKGDIGDLVDSELNKAADAIAAAAARLAKLKNKPRDGYSTYELQVHDSILDAAIAVTNAIAQLIKAATATQQEIVQAGRGSSSRQAFYKKNNRWTEGLISAAKAVASSTNTLIETADGVLSGRNSPEQLIVASNDVAASTAQLVAASRVKAGFRSKSQENLETASKAVGAACRSLVRQVQAMIKDRDAGEEDVDYGKLGAHEFKVREMEQQVEILQLENNLAAARKRLGEMRKISYLE